MVTEYGLSAIKKADLMSLSPICEQGVIEDYDELSQFMEYSLRELGVTELQNCNILFSHSIRAPNNQKIKEILIEELNFSGVHICQEPEINILYARGL